MKATAETLKRKLIHEYCTVDCAQPYFGDGCWQCVAAVKRITAALPITLEQLAGIANGELVVARRANVQEITNRDYHAMKYGDARDRLRSMLSASPEKDKTT